MPGSEDRTDEDPNSKRQVFNRGSYSRLTGVQVNAPIKCCTEKSDREWKLCTTPVRKRVLSFQFCRWMNVLELLYCSELSYSYFPVLRTVRTVWVPTETQVRAVCNRAPTLDANDWKAIVPGVFVNKASPNSPNERSRTSDCNLEGLVGFPLPSAPPKNTKTLLVELWRL